MYMCVECDKPLQLRISVKFPNNDADTKLGSSFVDTDARKQSATVMLKRGIR